MSKRDFFVQDNEIGKIELDSPSSKYKLTIKNYKTTDNGWSYSRGIVFSNGREIADVQRNYAQFPYSWIEGHKNGHDYLVCGEDYQGQTVIELDTGKRIDYLPEEAEQGAGFCWAVHSPSPDGTLLAVAGCYWACPWEVRVYDFANPMKAPHKILFQEDMMDEEDAWCTWKDGDTCILAARWGEVKETSKATFHLTAEEEAVIAYQFKEASEPTHKVWHRIYRSMIGMVTWNREAGVVAAVGKEEGNSS